MSRDIDLYKYDLDSLCLKIAELGKIEPSLKNIKKVKLILSHFGEIIGDKYIILNNEFQEEGNPYWNAPHAIEKAFGLDSDKFYIFEAFVDWRVRSFKDDLITYAETDQVLEEIKYELKEIDEDE